ncbi:hypothetical protein PR048_025046 [Dryococelus australis]|uniref:Uncharacterized protein n=1 Tax=Dryococelus australis TaxID=614101 RepID=A0ABQ9GQA8_9NEOP|nr:hypothetical protein PR048_025046 [Dryococelus australis]
MDDIGGSAMPNDTCLRAVRNNPRKPEGTSGLQRVTRAAIRARKQRPATSIAPINKKRPWLASSKRAKQGHHVTDRNLCASIYYGCLPTLTRKGAEKSQRETTSTVVNRAARKDCLVLFPLQKLQLFLHAAIGHVNNTDMKNVCICHVKFGIIADVALIPVHAVVWSPSTKASRVRFPVASPIFSYMRNLADVAVGWRVFSGHFRFRPPLHSAAAPSSPHFSVTRAQDVDNAPLEGELQQMRFLPVDEWLPGLTTPTALHVKRGEESCLQFMIPHAVLSDLIAIRINFNSFFLKLFFIRASQVGIVPDDASGRRVSSGMSRFLRPFIPALLHAHLTSTSSALKTPAQISSLTHFIYAIDARQHADSGWLTNQIRLKF